MNLLGYNVVVTQNFGWYSFLSLLALLILYLVKPKPFRKIIPSLIFLESSKKKANMTSFFKRFVRDWLFLLQLFLIAFLCLAALGLTTDIFIRKIDKDVVFVIDVSASSQAKLDGKKLIDLYKDIARDKLGVTNSVVLIKNTKKKNKNGEG